MQCNNSTVLHHDRESKTLIIYWNIDHRFQVVEIKLFFQVWHTPTFTSVGNKWLRPFSLEEELKNNALYFRGPRKDQLDQVHFATTNVVLHWHTISTLWPCIATAAALDILHLFDVTNPPPYNLLTNYMLILS